MPYALCSSYRNFSQQSLDANTLYLMGMLYSYEPPAKRGRGAPAFVAVMPIANMLYTFFPFRQLSHSNNGTISLDPTSTAFHALTSRHGTETA